MPQGWDLGVFGVKSVSLSVKLSPPKPLDEIQPNLVCDLLTLNLMGRATAHFWPCPPGEGPKGQISLNFDYSQFQRFLYPKICMSSGKYKK